MPIPFLPEAYGNIRSLGESGTWENYSGLLERLPDDLRISGTATADALTAIPTVWARPLLFAEALFDNEHPLHNEVEGEWRGIFALFCFKDYYKFQISVRQFEISEDASERFARVLHTLRPDNYWCTLHLIYLNDILIGGTSPKSLFFTAAQYEIPSTIVPWTNKKTGRFFNAAEYFDSNNMREELTVLREWVEDARVELAKILIPGDTRDEKIKNELLRIFHIWEDSIRRTGEVEKINFIAPVIDFDPYKTVSKAALVKEKVNSDFLLDSTKVLSHPPIVVWEEGWKQHKDKAVYGVFRPSEVPIPEEPEGEDLAGGKIDYHWIQPKLCFFTEKLLMLGLVKENILLHHKNDYIPPLKKEILKYFGPEDLKTLFEWKEKEDGVEVILKLPLKTGEGQRSPATPAVISRFYKHKDIKTIATKTPPYLVLWPNFKVNGEAAWKHYYCICEKREEPIILKPVQAELCEERGLSILWRIQEYTEAIQCLWEKVPIGLILLAQHRPIGSDTLKWKVAVDFGTSNTTIFFRKADDEPPQPLLFKNRCVQITTADPPELRFFLFKEFLPFPLEVDEEIKGVFPSHFRSFKVGPDAPKPFIDGIILFDEPTKWPEILESKDIEQNLKWTTDSNKRRLISTFLKQVILMIGAEARNAKVNEIKFYWSYPSAFAKHMINDLQGVWEGLSQAKNEIGINISVEPCQTESMAVCSYMEIEKNATKAATNRAQVIIDIGGGTSDIAIWLNGEMRAPASILLAGNILSRFAEKSKTFSDTIAKIAGNVRTELIQARPSAALNIILKRQESEILHALRSGQNITPEFKRARTIILFSFSSVFYYVGYLFKYIKDQANDQKNDINSCDIYLAGNGAKLLNWVSSKNAVNDALKEIFKRATQPLSLNPIGIHFPEAHKEEVARGLLYAGQFPQAEKRILHLLGESGYQLRENGNVLSWNFNIHRENDVLDLEKLRVPDDFQELKKFLKAYDDEAKNLGLEEISHLVESNTIKAGMEQRISKLSEMKKDDMALIQPFFIEEVKCVLEKLITC